MLVGVSKGSDDKLAEAIVTVFVVAVVIGLVNGLLVAVLDLNPLIVTLATGLILLGINAEYRAGIANSTTVPDSLADFVFDKVFGISKTFWFVVALTLVLGVDPAIDHRRSSLPGGRRQPAGSVDGGHPRQALRRSGPTCCAAIAAGLAAIFIGGIVVSPGVDPGVDLPARSGGGGGARRRRPLRRSRQSVVDLAGRLLRDAAQPDVEGAWTLERLAVRRLRRWRSWSAC